MAASQDWRPVVIADDSSDRSVVDQAVGADWRPCCVGGLGQVRLLDNFVQVRGLDVGGVWSRAETSRYHFASCSLSW